MEMRAEYFSVSSTSASREPKWWRTRPCVTPASAPTARIVSPRRPDVATTRIAASSSA